MFNKSGVVHFQNSDPKFKDKFYYRDCKMLYPKLQSQNIPWRVFREIELLFNKIALHVFQLIDKLD